MYFLITIFLGWLLLNFIVTSIELIFQLPSGSIKDPVFMYVFIGYFVSMVLHIKSPFINEKKENPFTSLKKIEINLFFKDLYYAIWWPYYIVRELKKK
jgi:uncharacterized metal-binding protein